MSTQVPAIASRSPLKGPRGIVPYIATWSAEQDLPTEVIETARGIAYADEIFIDRDLQGVLWTRAPSRPGHGEPLYNRVHPLRQRRAMRRLLCQVCAKPADQNDQGTLWVLPDWRGDWPNWPEGMGNAQPPVCLRCARISVRSCPALRPGFAAVRAHSTIGGVSGALYRPGFPLPKLVDTCTLAYDDRAIRWMRAAQLIRELYDCTIVDL